MLGGAEYPPWATCSNTSYRREALEKLGGFETRWPARLGGDDTDLGLRLGKSGYRLRGNPDAVVLHSRATWNSFSAVWKRAFRWGRMDVHLYYRRHTDRVKLLLPGFRSLLILLVLASLVTAGLTLSAWPLLTPLAWFVLFVLLRAALTCGLGEEAREGPGRRAGRRPAGSRMNSGHSSRLSSDGSRHASSSPCNVGRSFRLSHNRSWSYSSGPCG